MREGRIFASLLAAGALSLGLAGTASALVDDNASLAQPATELVMPFDNSFNRASYLIVSNPYASSPAVAAVTTHWTFWGADCQELANFSICLTTNDTVVVDPTNMTAIGADNKPSGPTINLSGQRGIVTVTAYQTDTDCNPWDETGRRLAQGALVGTFTIADLTYGYSIGNDALGLFSANNQVQLPSGDVRRYVLETLNPTTEPGVEAGSLVISSWLVIDKNGLAVPSDEGEEFWLTHHDNLEIATSLPDVSIDCVAFRSLTGGESPLIPDYVTPEGLLLPSYVVPASSGFLSLAPTPATGRLGDRYLFSFIGQAVGGFGASSHAKVQLD